MKIHFLFSAKTKKEVRFLWKQQQQGLLIEKIKKI